MHVFKVMREHAPHTVWLTDTFLDNTGVRPRAIRYKVLILQNTNVDTVIDRCGLFLDLIESATVMSTYCFVSNLPPSDLEVCEIKQHIDDGKKKSFIYWPS